MMISFDLISGCMLGIEFGEDEEGDTVIVIDLFIVRILIG
jgi:hypothetical protein